ncbi:MAG: type IV secretion system DNA-binding domain-containing protein [Thiotrichales bacterium]|nr:type IV secretion system DNA-binding domain-containing protein [Thiotrichales bacterium]
MTLEIADLSTATFSTTRAADDICSNLTRKIGWPHRYVAARLAIARSLSLPALPPPLTEEEADDMATALRGMQLFGEGVDPAAWLSLIVQRSGDRAMTRRSFRALVSAHWKRGAELLKKDWEHAGGDMAGFVARLAELANFPVDVENGTGKPTGPAAPVLTGAVHLSVGEAGRDDRTGEHVTFALNGAGGSPHMAIMGGVGSGKTRTAIHVLKDLRRFGGVPLLAFDFKGDLTEGLSADYDAGILSPPDDSVPLDVLHVGSRDDNAIRKAAARIRDSIASVKSRKLSGIQSDALREAIATTLRACANGRAATLSYVARALGTEYEERGRGQDELTATLNELTQFDLFVPDGSPGDFFSRSWIIRLPQDSSEEMRRLIINLTLNALDGWLNGRPDAPTDDQGIRALRHVTLLDEAHVILRTRLPALANLVRMSRSKGGVVMLVSQSPDDFEAAEDGYLDNMGLTLAFNTQARAGPTRRIFGDGHALTGLNVGEALCRIRSEAKTRRVVAWEP